MNKYNDGQNEVTFEAVDSARRLYRIFIGRLLLVCIGGLAGAVLLEFKYTNINIRLAGENIATWWLIATVVAVVILFLRVEYKISRLLKIPFILAFGSGSILLPMFISSAAAKLGYKIGPFFGSLRPMPPDTGTGRFRKFITNGIAIVILICAVGAAVFLNSDQHNTLLPQWVTDVFTKSQNIAINKTIEKSPLNIPGYNRQQLERVAAITAHYDRANKLPFDHFITNTSYISNPVTEEERSSFRKMLSQWWDIDSRAQALETLNWLKEAGHNEQFAMMAEALTDGSASAVLAKAENDPALQRRIQVVRDNSKQLGEHGIIAWDLTRLAYVAQASYYAGYISREEAWKEMIYAAATTQKAFSSWNEMSQSFLIGREFWNGEKDPKFSETITWLLSNDNSPWVKNKWDIPLGKGLQ